MDNRQNKSNSERRGVVPDYLREPYVPEHVRLGRAPQDGLASERAVHVPAQAPDRPMVVPPRPRTTRQPNSPKGAVLPVHIGNHEDQMWLDSHQKELNQGEYLDMPRPPRREEYVDNNDYVDVENLQLRSEVGALRSSRDATDAGAWARAHQEAEAYAEAQRQQNSLPQPGEFMVVLDGQVVAVSSDVDSIKTAIENILLTKDISPDEIVVYKRMEITFGVLVNG